MQLKTLFNPKSVAIIGADDKPASVGYALMKNITAGSKRKIYPVTLGKKELLGLATYKSVKDVKGSIDLAVIAIRGDIVPSVLTECAEKGIKNVVVISAGFKETGKKGAQLEEKLTTIAKENDMALLGPNCLGIMDAQTDWNASFAVEKPKAGDIAFVSQSGALGTALLDWANKEGIGFSKFVSLGNEASLTELEFMEYLANDPDTNAVLLYLEKVSDGERFMKLARKITSKKPLIVLRAGRSPRGSAAVASHTGSLAPSDKVFEAALKQVGAIPVDSLRLLFSFAKLLALGVTKPLQNLVILTNGGGPSVTTADLIDFSKSLSLATFSDDTKEALRNVLPPMAAVGNPIDVIGDAGPERYADCLQTLVKLDEVDAIITLVTPQMMTDPKGIAKVLATFSSKKPIIPVFMGGHTIEEGVATLQESGLVGFDTPSDVVYSLDALARGGERPPEPLPDEGDEPRLSTHLAMMHIEEMQTLLSDYDLPLAGAFVKKKEGLTKALKTLGEGPYAIKAISQQLVHKSDLKAVQLGLGDADALTGAWEEIVAYVEGHTENAKIDGMLVQQMVSGTECIIGMKRDDTFGPVIVFGLGGIYVEILKDSSIRIAPVTKKEVLAQVSSIQGLPLLTGARGRDAVDLDAIANAIVALSSLALDFPDIQEIDFNPVFATPKGVHIVDARIMK